MNIWKSFLGKMADKNELVQMPSNLQDLQASGHKEDANIWFQKGNHLAQAGHYEKAISCFDHALNLEPKHNLSLKAKGLSLMRLRDYNKAFRCFGTALGLDTGKPPGWGESDPKDAHAWLYFGNAAIALCCSERKDFSDRVSCLLSSPLNAYEQALKIDNRLADAWAHKGGILFMKEFPGGNLQDSLSCLNIALNIDNRNSYAWYNKGVSFGTLGKFQEAMDCLNKVVEMDSDFKNNAVQAASICEQYLLAMESPRMSQNIEVFIKTSFKIRFAEIFGLTYFGEIQEDVIKSIEIF